MNDLALVIHTDPSKAYYRGTRPAGVDLARAGLISIGEIRSELRIEGRTANSHTTAAIDNGRGHLTAELAAAPLRSPAAILRNGVEIWRGLVTRIRVGAVVQIDLEAGGERPYTDLMPLRTSAAWSTYDTIDTLPHLYGRTVTRPRRYLQDTNRLHLADHPLPGIDRVERADTEYGAWRLLNTTDTTGHPVALLEVDTTVDDPGEWRVWVRGKQHQETGALLERPDQILWDLHQVIGRPIEESALDDLRVYCESQGLTIAGQVDDAEATIQTVIDRLCQGSGLAWSPDLPGLAMPWPREPAANPVQGITQRQAAKVSAEADHSHLATVLVVEYDYDWSTQAYRRTATLRAPEAVERYGEIEATLQLGWIHAPGLALETATRWLQYRARPRWNLNATVLAAGHAIGADLFVSHAHSTMSAGVIAKIGKGDLNENINLMALAGDVPAVEITSTGQA